MKMKNMLVGGVVAFLVCAGLARAATYNWTPTAAGTYQWDDATSNWTSGFPNAVDDVANVRISNGTGNIIINLNQAITVGTLYLGNNSNDTGRSFTINANGGSLIMDVSTGDALISKTQLKSPDTINANILINDNLVVNSSSSDSRGHLYINGNITGTGSLTKTGNNTARIVGTHTYDGGTTISAGMLQLGSGSGANTTVVGNIVNNGWLGFNDAAARSFAAANYSGTGGLDKLGAGTLTLTGAFDVNGGMRVGYLGAGGTVTVGSGNSLAVGSGSTDHLYVGVGYNGAAGSGILNVVDATSFTASVGTVYVGINALYPYGGGGSGGSGASGTGTLSLGVNNSITAATQIVIGGGDPDGNTGIAGGSNGYITTAASGTTTIATPYMALGTAKGTQGTFTLGTGATLNLGSSGSRTELILGRSTATAHNPAGTMNLAGGGSGVANLYLKKLSLGYTTAGGSPTGSMTLSDSATNNLNVSGASGTGGVVQLGYNSTTGTTTGTLTIGNLGASSAITSDDNGTAILIARKGTGTSTGELTLKAGTLTITTTGAAIAGGGGTSRLYLGETGNVTLKAGANSTDWIAGLTTAEIKSGGLTVDTNGKDIGISQEFSGAGGLIKDGAGTLTLSGTQGYTGATEIKTGELSLTGSLNVGSAVTVRSGAGISGTGTVNGSLHFDAGANLSIIDNNLMGANPLDVAGNVTFSGFGVANILGFDSMAAELGTPYTLIAGSNVSFTNVSNTTPQTAYDFGNGRKGYFQSGSLQLIVIPEPATFGIVLGALAAAVIRRKRLG